MRFQSESNNEAEIVYWQSRVASLELMVCELLINNQRLREDLHQRPVESTGDSRSYVYVGHEKH